MSVTTCDTTRFSILVDTKMYIPHPPIVTSPSRNYSGQHTTVSRSTFGWVTPANRRKKNLLQPTVINVKTLPKFKARRHRQWIAAILRLIALHLVDVRTLAAFFTHIGTASLLTANLSTGDWFLSSDFKPADTATIVPHRGPRYIATFVLCPCRKEGVFSLKACLLTSILRNLSLYYC
jgi:hypothetical protein